MRGAGGERVVAIADRDYALAGRIGLVAARVAGVEPAAVGVERDDRHAGLEIGEDAAGIARQRAVEVTVGIDRAAIIDRAVHPFAIPGDAGVHGDQRAAIFAHRLEPRLEAGILIVVRHEPQRTVAVSGIGDPPQPPRRAFLAELDPGHHQPLPLSEIAVPREIVVLHRQRIDPRHPLGGIADGGTGKRQPQTRKEKGADQRGAGKNCPLRPLRPGSAQM